MLGLMFSMHGSDMIHSQSLAPIIKDKDIVFKPILCFLRLKFKFRRVFTGYEHSQGFLGSRSWKDSECQGNFRFRSMNEVTGIIISFKCPELYSIWMEWTADRRAVLSNSERRLSSSLFIGTPNRHETIKAFPGGHGEICRIMYKLKDYKDQVQRKS